MQPDILPPTVLEETSVLRRLARKAGIDRAIAYTVLARGWAASAGLVTVALIAHFLSPIEQGYYYTFGSLVAMQLIFELGFSVVIQQFASHEAAHLKFTADGNIDGDTALTPGSPPFCAKASIGIRLPPQPWACCSSRLAGTSFLAIRTSRILCNGISPGVLS